jgi:hypothetical protein
VAAPAEACIGDPDCVIFITGNVFPGDMYGTTPDARCLPGSRNGIARLRNRTFKAWVSDASGSAATRLKHSTKPYVRSDGVQIAANWTALASPMHTATITLDETGSPYDNFGVIVRGVWTGTLGYGSTALDRTTRVPETCSGWTSAGNALGRAGDETATNGTWTWLGPSAAPCAEKLHLYCVQQ